MSIINNRKALHDYFVEDRFEAGLVLEGWEVKAIREGRVQLRDSYVRVKGGEIWLLGCHISPLISASTHISADSERIKKLLLNRKEIDRLIGRVEQKGYSIVALNLHYKKGKVKAEIALAKGKKLHDKRASEKEKEANREKAQVLKQFKRL
jgi:SsrA-binding protein